MREFQWLRDLHEREKWTDGSETKKASSASRQQSPAEERGKIGGEGKGREWIQPGVMGMLSRPVLSKQKTISTVLKYENFRGQETQKGKK